MRGGQAGLFCLFVVDKFKQFLHADVENLCNVHRQLEGGVVAPVFQAPDKTKSR